MQMAKSDKARKLFPRRGPSGQPTAISGGTAPGIDQGGNWGCPADFVGKKAVRRMTGRKSFRNRVKRPGGGDFHSKWAREFLPPRPQKPARKKQGGGGINLRTTLPISAGPLRKTGSGRWGHRKRPATTNRDASLTRPQMRPAPRSGRGGTAGGALGGGAGWRWQEMFFSCSLTGALPGILPMEIVGQKPAPRQSFEGAQRWRDFHVRLRVVLSPIPRCWTVKQKR